MGKVTVIEAKKTNIAPEAEERPKKRVAAYCRVSTDHEDQETSFEGQQKHFTTLINGNPDWELVGIYADEESGTSVYKRDDFLRMISDCENGLVDLVLTKSISRFARNTVDATQTIRKLKAFGIPIIFTKEGINTMDSGGEVLVTILASLAQQESASISQNVQIGVRYHYQEGKVCSGVHRLLGYNRTPDGKLEIVPREAEIVRRIFRDFLDGYSTKAIAKRLREEGVDGSKTTVTGIKIERNWNYENIEYILKNEKYSGDLLLQKYYTVDYLTKKVAKNNGERTQYYLENAHPPIVPKEIFTQVAAERERRRKNWKDQKCYDNELAGRVVCGDCGTAYQRVKAAKGCADMWRCGSKRQREKHADVVCNSRGIREDRLHEIVIEAFNRLPEVKAELTRLDERLRWAGIDKADALLKEIDARILAEGENEELEQQMREIIERRAVYADKAVHIRNLLERIDAIEGKAVKKEEAGDCTTGDTFFAMTRKEYAPGPVTEYDRDDVMRMIEKIVVGDVIEVVFKAGVSLKFDR